MADRKLTARQAHALAKVQANLSKDGFDDYLTLGHDVAWELRREFTELTDGTLACLMGNLAAYGHNFAKANGDAGAVELAAVLAGAAIDLAALDAESTDDPA